MTPPLLSVESLNLAIGDADILKDVSFELGEGEILGLVGASGSGKSLTALSIMRLLPRRAALRGSIVLRGLDLTAQNEARLREIRGRDIGMVFQEPLTALNPLMRIGDQVAETVRLHTSASAKEANAKAREALDSVGLRGDQGALSRYPSELSGGQRQRVAIAIAIVLEPALLLADEPTTALDAGTQAHVLGLLRELARSRNMGLLLVSHDLAVVAQMTDRIAILHEGRIVEQGPTTQTLRHLEHPYARALLAAAQLTPKPTAKDWRGAPDAGRSDGALLEVRDVVREYPLERRSFRFARPAARAQADPALAGTASASTAPSSTARFATAAAFRAVDGVSLEVYPGETVGLVGESGSGKSSLLRSILALDRPQAGEVRLLGQPFAAPTARPSREQRRAIQAVFQDPYGSFDPQWSVEQLIAEPFFLMQTPPRAAERRRRVARVLEQVGLAATDAARYPHEFSGGQRQRIAIARALITEPAVITFDEALSALDVLVRAQILALLLELSARLKLAYLFVSHDLAVVRAIADRIYVMQHGRIVEEGPTPRVFDSPRHVYTQHLIAAMPRLPGG